jgi:hypothetical protein
MTEKTEKEVKTEKTSTSELSMPTSVSIEQILRAVKILSDNGGKARWGKISTSFGTKVSEKNLLNWALNAAVAFDLVMPHARKAEYVLSEDGIKFTSLQEDQQKFMMLGKFLKFEGYKTILVSMKNNQDKALKKAAITEMWSQIRSNMKLNTRQLYTQTFASVGEWSGALVDTGQSCSLNPQAETVLDQVLRGEEPKTAKQISSTGGSSSIGGSPADRSKETGSNILVSNCPHCGKTEIDIENEELLQTLSGNGIHTLIIKNTYFCKGCSRTFSRIDQKVVKVGN